MLRQTSTYWVKVKSSPDRIAPNVWAGLKSPAIDARTGCSRECTRVERNERQRVEEVYTIKQVAEMTGVPDNTIRSWERRFGIPAPGRSGTNQRRYSRADIEAINSIQASRHRGRTMEQAISELRQETSGQAKSPINVGEPMESAASVQSPVGLPELLANALIGFDPASAKAVVADASWSSSVEKVSFDLLLATHEAITVRHAEGRLSSLQARFAQAWIMTRLQAAYDQSDPESGRLTIVVLAMYDTSAKVASLCVATTLSRAGYSVLQAGSGCTHDDVVQLARRIDPAAIVLVADSRWSQVSATSVAMTLHGESSDVPWRGTICVIGVDESLPPTVVSLERDPHHIVSNIEVALQAHASNIRLMRSK
jgi:DNA-binding transcriptional MerR regulator